MHSNWLNVGRDAHGRDEGLRPSFAEILKVLDSSDPAIVQITQALRDARDAGAGLTTATVAEAVRLGRQRYSEQAESPPDGPNEPIAPAFESTVYYILRGRFVKIGTTRHPDTRFSDLVPDRILAVEPGDRAVERKRHVQFRHLRNGTSEYFEQGDDLMAHVAAVRAEYGAPNPAWRSVETIDRPRPDFHISPPAATSAELVTAAEGADRLGVRRNTVAGWVHRKRLRPVGKGGANRPLYFLDDMKFLAGRSAAMTETRVVRRS